MKKILIFSIVLAILASLTTVYAQRGNKFLWLECESSAVFSGDYRQAADKNASGGAYVKLDSTNADKNHEVSFFFTIDYADTYDVFVLGTPGDQTWASNPQYKINKNVYQKDNIPALITAKGYNTSDGRNAGVSWRKLGTMAFEKGRHSISYLCDQKRTVRDDFFYQVLDTIVIVPKSWQWSPVDVVTQPIDAERMKLNFISAQVPDQKFRQNDTFAVQATYRLSRRAPTSPQLYVEIVSKGQTVYSCKKQPAVSMKNWLAGYDYTEEFTLQIPFNLKNGTYDIQTGIVGATFEDGESVKKIGEITVGDLTVAAPPKQTWENTKLTMEPEIKKGGTITATLEYSLSELPQTAVGTYLCLWKGDALWYVADGAKEFLPSAHQGTAVLEYTIDPVLPSGEYEATVGIYTYQETTGKRLAVNIAGSDTEKTSYYRPMSYGYFASKTGKTHFWYINQNSAYIWNGEPYVPMGGMFVSRYISGFDVNNPAQNKINFEQDAADLSTLREAGYRDLYINAVGGGDARPVWAWEYLFDYLDENGWRYGLQANVNNNPDVEAFYPHATESAGLFAVRDITKSGHISLTVDKNFVNNFISCTTCHYILVDNATGEAKYSGEGTLSVDDELKNIIFEADIKVEEGTVYTAYFVPKILGRAQLALNYWGGGQQMLQRLESFAQRFEFGDGFRLWVDLTVNEMGYYNRTESTRYYDEVFNLNYENWLAQKYTSIDALEKAWISDRRIPDFETASRLVPIFTSEKDSANNSYTFYINPENNDIYRLDTHNGVSWQDYLDARDEMYMDFNNQAAEAVKKYVDVPVVYKHCSVPRAYFMNDETVYGFDGVGSEAYGPAEKVERQMGLTASHTMQSARTMWSIVTETNTNENIYQKQESGIGSYASQEEMYAQFDGFFRAGAKGVFDFLLIDRPDSGGLIGEAYSHIQNPKVIPWMAEYIEKIKNTEQEIANYRFQNPTYYMYPATCLNWWWTPNERNCVQLNDDIIPTAYVETPGGSTILPTNSLNVDSDIIFVNLADAPYTTLYGRALSQLLQNNVQNKKIVVIGHRNNLGAIPELDQFYTDQYADLPDGGTVQVLKPTPNTEVYRQTEDGQVWAMREGNIYMISSSAMFVQDGEKYIMQYVEDLGIL